MLPSQNDDSSSIRRACSLSDLSMGKGKKTNPLKFIKKKTLFLAP